MRVDGETEVGTRMLRLFAVSWGLILSVAGYFLADGLERWIWPLAGVIFCGAGLFRPRLMRGPYRIVERGLRPVGHLLSLLLLAMVYYGVFTSYAVILSLTGWDPLRLKQASRGVSAWNERSGRDKNPDYHWQY